jgi:VWFA-related protein
VSRHRHLFVPLVALLMVVSRPEARQDPGRQAAPPPGQQVPPVTFKVEINYVEVDAVVVDQNGEFVRTLAKDDFQILEDGNPQTVSTFGLVDIPVERAEAPLFVNRAVEPDVETNASGLDGRIYLIVLDDLHTAALRSQWVKRAARQFIERELGANDLAAVVATGGRTDNSQDFTSNKRLLLAAVDRFMGNALRSATANKLDEYNRLRSSGTSGSGRAIVDTDEQHRAYNARKSLDTLRLAADFLSGVRGRRKALIFISEGIDYDVTDPFNNVSATDIMVGTRDAIAAATRANVNFYTVDPRGLTTLADDAIEMSAPPADPTLGLGTEALQRELLLSQDSLRVLAEETGGFAAVNSNDFARAFNRIRQENSTYYVLGYYPTNERRDGRFRRIDVRVTRPGLTVRARRGYAAPRGKTPPAPALDIREEVSPAVKEALSSPVPVAGLQFAVFAAPFKGKAPDASVLVVVQADGRGLRLVEKDGAFVDTLELSMLALDSGGKVQGGGRQLLNLTLKPETRAAVSRAGVRVMDRLNLRPGRYQLRVVAADSAPGVLGSVNYYLEIPDFRAAPLSMSGVVLTSSRAAETPSANMDADLKRLLPGPPTTQRVFSAGEELALLAEIYDTQGATPHKVDIVTTVQSDDGRVLFTHADERSSSEFGGSSGGFGYTARVPLKGLAPGLYLLKVEARSRLGLATKAAREVQFRIQ